MLSILEKIQYALGGLVVLLTVALYVWQPPDNRSADLRAPVKRVPVRPTAQPAKTVEAASPASGPPKPAAPAVSVDDKAILDRLTKEQNLRGLAGKELLHEDLLVDPDTFDYAKRETNWVPELNKAKSELLAGADGKPTRLKIYDIEEGSLLRKFGLEDGDTVEFIDGERMDFSEGSAQHIKRWKRLQEKLASGGSVPITVTRNGQPMQLQFKVQ